MNKQSPGPWAFVNEVEKSFCSRTGEPRVRELTWIRDSRAQTLFLRCTPDPKYGVSGASEADIKLVAAAPDLFEAAKFVSECMDHSCEANGGEDEEHLCPRCVLDKALAKAGHE